MIKYLIHRPVAVTMILIALVVIGIVGIKNIPVSLMPDIDIPQITVQESMPGCSAQEMEKRVIAPLRGAACASVGREEHQLRLSNGCGKYLVEV